MHDAGLITLVFLLLSGCGEVDSGSDDSLPGMQRWQIGSACGANCLYCLLRVYGRVVDYDRLLDLLRPTSEGNSLEELRSAASKYGLETSVYRVRAREVEELRMPVIAHMEDRGIKHYVLVVGMRANLVHLWDVEEGRLATTRQTSSFDNGLVTRWPRAPCLRGGF